MLASTEAQSIFTKFRVNKTFIPRGSRNLTPVFKIVLLQKFKINCILIIKSDTSNISFKFQFTKHV